MAVGVLRITTATMVHLSFYVDITCPFLSVFLSPVTYD
jgi:hypothetical protein